MDIGARRWRLSIGLLPALVATVFLIPESKPKPTYGYLYDASSMTTELEVGPPYPWPWVWPSRTLVAILGIALAVAVIVTARYARRPPVPALASGLALASVAYPVAWVATRTEQLPFEYWMLNGAYPLLFAVVPLVLALLLMRRAAA